MQLEIKLLEKVCLVDKEALREFSLASSPALNQTVPF
jgi:hypothetical protein